MKDFLKQEADASGIVLTDDMLCKFEIFYRELIKANRYMNLTAITDQEEVVLKHFIDSMAVSAFYDFSGASIIDIGTGAGFPSAEFVLLDSLKKRLHFIETVLELCEMENVRLLHGRAEDFGKDAGYREQFDFCVSRAVASMPVLLELCTPFVKVGGVFVSYKSELLKEELEESQHAMKELRCSAPREHRYVLPDTDFYRVYAAFKKEEATPSKYPRQAGKPKKKPL